MSQCNYRADLNLVSFDNNDTSKVRLGRYAAQCIPTMNTGDFNNSKHVWRLEGESCPGSYTTYTVDMSEHKDSTLNMSFQYLNCIFIEEMYFLAYLMTSSGMHTSYTHADGKLSQTSQFVFILQSLIDTNKTTIANCEIHNH